MEELDFPAPCVSTRLFAEQFPRTMKRHGVDHLTGTVLRADSSHEDCYIVKWTGITAPERLHESFFRIVG